MAIEQQAYYYFKLLASLKEGNCSWRANRTISAETRTIDALSQKELAWLSNVGIDALTEMHMKNRPKRGEDFRERLSKTTSLLAEADLGDMDRVAADITRSIGSIVNEHRKEVLKIEDKYKPKYSGMAVKGWLSVRRSADTAPGPLGFCCRTSLVGWALRADQNRRTAGEARSCQIPPRDCRNGKEQPEKCRIGMKPIHRNKGGIELAS